MRDTPAMLRELNVVEQRYQAVLEVLDGTPVTEVAQRFGVARQTVHRWVARYRESGLDGLADRSHAPQAHPWRVSAEIEAVICDLRTAHRSWGPRRLAFELERRGHPGVSRSTVYRVLVRYHLIEPVSRRRRRDQYRRWERSAAMELWQMDVTASLFLADGRECKVITGIDDYSRFCVIATVVARATGRAVCLAFTTAMAEYGIPAEVLSDNGKQFTGRFGRPRPAEVLFERICRENGITQRLTKPRSPTTTGKIERLHQTLQLELLNVHGPFASVEDAQVAVDAWRKDYNTRRPHQSLNMAFPAARFTAPAADGPGLRIPAELTRKLQPPAAAEEPEPDHRAGCTAPARPRQRQRASQGRRAGPGSPSVGQPLDRGTAGLARARDDRAHRPALGRSQPGSRPARRPPDQDPAVPARRPRPGPPHRVRRPARRAAAAASGSRGRN